jgi:hypothetical protein
MVSRTRHAVSGRYDLDNRFYDVMRAAILAALQARDGWAQNLIMSTLVSVTFGDTIGACVKI